MTVGKLNNGCAVALGNFDGMHIGHVRVLEQTAQLTSQGLTATVMLFDEHSLKGVRGEAPPMLMTEEERLSFIKEKGLEVTPVSFSEIRDLSPEAFVDTILIARLNAKAVVCGFNYRLGKNATGDARMLREICAVKGIRCVVVDEVETDGTSVNSTSIRKAIEIGDITAANKMLGRSFGFSATVIDGDKRGREWGFPTINQKLPEGLVIPRFGVYKSTVKLDGKEYDGVTNIGLRPTVGTDTVRSETHILSFDGNLYGKDIDVRLISFIRPEKKFDSFDELILQIKSDISLVKGGA
jgi:riboflavin kinase/FMN adenylyltransferase